MFKKPLLIVGLFVILAAIPLTVFLSQQQQEIRQRAAEASDCDNHGGLKWLEYQCDFQTQPIPPNLEEMVFFVCNDGTRLPGPPSGKRCSDYPGVMPPTPTPQPAATWIPSTCTGGTFSGCTLSGEPVCNNYGDPAKGIGTDQLWGICNNICSTADRNASCDRNTLRPPLCERTWADKTSVTSRDSITINSKANIPLKKFMFAFYNQENSTSGGPQPIFYEGNQHYTPTVELPGPQSQTFRTFSYQDLARPDNNWGGKIPTRIQVNGYFFDDQNNQSKANPACVASFTLAVAPTPTPLAADVDRNECVGIVDFNLWVRAFQTGTVQSETYPDINNDGRVDLLDFNAWYKAMRSLAGTDRLCP